MIGKIYANALCTISVSLNTESTCLSLTNGHEFLRLH
jgi:hypothetical protein